jgi:Periplasmic binding protein
MTNYDNIASKGAAAAVLARLVLFCLALGVAAFFFARSAAAVDEAQAAKGPPFNIDVLVSSRTDVCYDPGDVVAIKTLTERERDRINSRGGVSGRPIQLTFHDDARNEKLAIDNVRKAVAGTQTLAIVGLSNATRGKAVFDAVGPEILKSGIPFLSDISVNNIFAAFPNVYTTRASQDIDSIPVMARFARHLDLKRAAFVGLKDSVAGGALADGLRTELGEGVLAASVQLGVEKDKLIADEVKAAIATLSETRPDLIFLNVGGANAASVIKELVSSGNTPALFIGGRIDALPKDIANSYPNAIYSLAWDRPPEVYNDRLRKRVSRGTPEQWIFEGAKIDAAPGWAKGECKPRELGQTPDPFTPENLRALSVGSQYADMVALVAAAATLEDQSTDIERLRAAILAKLKSNFAAGRGAFKGSFDNWSFVPSTRTAARDPFIIILPQGLGRTQLAPVQFVRTKDGGLRQIETLYVDIDLIKAHRVDENAKSFYAEFYLSMRDSPQAGIDKIDFSNAYLDAQSGGGKQIVIETVHPGGRSSAYPDTMKIYKVSGRFLFNPELANYPFDAQRFAIDLQPKNAEAPFIVQPPPLALRDSRVVSDGWEARDQYVGYDQDFVPVVDAFTHAPSVVPFYTASFAWLMQREATDYFLRVAVPLGFILFVAYLSIFIPRTHFEAIVTIQVTALLSAVALYLSLPKIDSGSATLSDLAFVFAYLILSIMIGISILRINPRVGGIKGAELVLGTLHITAVPIFVAVALYYVYGLSQVAL